ncbi:MAG: Asp-tRNA(Asn)/Glu-tRNA(Gln) amidotransferase subunit GatA [Candidatus Pacebacteria bacterium CG_4_10_14_0_8_um_filter_43_12]|nr:MAG: Asp-tRNA(Asn)/Glu-tRNA(Gln) amidotransferase subunit GatA [Candidatus Pacebacteria bacterium CG10_big_fil_rev_8_21_14_0_10_44_11]PIY79340.1 MAG: Asp-tRNA(Asn)/Glu-tRNA(Gln) amidotransferase subunit GatA [Candidatus Pacebacteria bacterium CG_4_10_14_0_8_um_filter_43_12]
MTNQLCSLTLAQTLNKLQKKEIQMSEIVQSVLDSIKKQDSTIHAFLTQNEGLLGDVKAREKLPLAGLPIAVKDNICTKGLRTTASSLVLDKFLPQYTATIVEKVCQAGATIIGKTNLDAWAHGSSTETSQYGRTLNPRNTGHLPGGSSGGSAAAVAADMSIVAIGTETAGSIRQPAAWCGVVGLKPTYGRVSRYGVIAMASSTDSPGPIAKTVQDAAMMLNYLAGQDLHDPTTSPQAVPDFTQSLGKSIKGLKVGLLYQDIEGMEIVKSHIDTAAKVLTELGAKVEPTQALSPQYAISVYTIVQRGEVSSNLARYDGIRFGNDRTFFGDEAKRRIMLGTYTLSKGYADKYYLTAQKARTLFIQDYQKLFEKYDCLISATSPSFAKKIGVTENAAMFGELEDMLLEPSSITGLPGISVPCYKDPQTNLFIGLNIIAPMWREDRVIQIADAFEKATDWNTWKETK